MKALELERIETSTKKGFEISEAIREGIILALQEGRRVTVEHNEMIFAIDPESIISSVYGSPHGKDGALPWNTPI